MSASQTALVGADQRVVFAGKAGNSRALARGVADRLGIKDVLEVHAEDFADNEVYVRLPVERLKRSLAGAHAVYVQTTVPMENHHFIEMLLTIDALRQQGVGEVDLVVPYMVHARQDKVFRDGEAVSIRAILRAIKAMKVDRIFTVDVHFWRAFGRVDFQATGIGPIVVDGSELEVYNLTATGALALYARDVLRIEKPVIVIPDKGHRPAAAPVERFFNSSADDVVLFDKVRKRDDVSVSLASGRSVPDLAGRQLLLFDDMVGTGTTIAKVAGWLQDRGAKDITLACTHAINHKRKAPGEEVPLTTLERLTRAGVSRIVTTDTIKNKEPISRHIVPVAPIIADGLRDVVRANVGLS